MNVTDGLWECPVLAANFTAIWMSLRGVGNRKPSPYAIAVAAFFSTWALAGMFNVINPAYALVVMPLLASAEFDTLAVSGRQPAVRLVAAT